MPNYIVAEYVIWRYVYLVEADDEEHAKMTYPMAGQLQKAEKVEYAPEEPLEVWHEDDSN